MTSLANQLQKLAIPGQPSFQQLTAKKRTPSFLFQPEEVGDITIDTIFSLGQNGLEELISMDPSFVEFENHLFSDSCKGFERTMQTKEVLEDVDKKLGTFLRLLSPYFMLKPAHKCLEWLVRVFRVHCHNVDALMECVLPYYQTLLFVRVVQLIPLKDHALSKWVWLQPVKRSGSRLSKLTLTQHCLSDLSFFVFVCECVPASLKACLRSSASNASRPSISLYTSTVLDVLETASPVTEDLVMRLMPYVKKGLKSENSEYKASTYMIVSQLAVVVDMEDVLVANLVELVCKSLCKSLLKEGLCCVAVLCHTQKPARLSHKSLQYLRLHSPVSTLATLHHTHYITPLISVLLLSLFSACMERLEGDEQEEEEMEERGSFLSLLQEILDEIELEQETALKLIRQLLVGGVAALESGSEEIGNPEYVEWVRGALASLARSLDAKYPTMMDKALEQTLAAIYSQSHTSSSTDGNGVCADAVDRKVKLLHEVVSSSFPQSSRHKVLVAVGTTLSASVHHPSPDMRAAAFTQLGEMLQCQGKKTSAMARDDFVISSLLGGLADESPVVVQAVLNLGHTVLFKQLPLDSLVSSLTSLLARKSFSRTFTQWQEVCLSSVSLLTCKPLLAAPPEMLDDVVLAWIPLLYVDRRGSDFPGRVAEKMGQSHLVKGHPVLEALAGLSSHQVWLDGVESDSHGDKEKLAAANALVFSHIGEGVAKLEGSRLSDMMSKLMGVAFSASQDGCAYFAYMAVVVTLLKATPTTLVDAQHRLVLRLVQHIHENVQALEGGKAADTAVLDGGLVAVFLPLAEEPCNKVVARRLLFTSALQAMCDHMTIPTDLSSSMWLDLTKASSQEQLYYDLLVSIFSLLIYLVDSQQGGKGHSTAAKPAGKGHTTGKLLLYSFFKRYFSGCGTLLRFLAMIWTAPAGMELEYGATLDPVLQSCGLGIGCAYVQSLDSGAAVALITEHCPIVPSLLIPLASPHKVVRDRALDCLQALQDACSPVYSIPPHSKKSPVQTVPSALSLVQGITKVRLEVSLDPSQINDVLQKLFDCIVPDPPPTPSKRRSKRIAGTTTGGVATPTAAEGTGPPRTWLDGLVVHVVGLGMPCNVQNQVLRLLDRVDDTKKLLSLIPLLCTIMDDMIEKQKQAMDVEDPLPRDDHSVEGLSADVEGTLSLLVQCFSPAIAPSLSQHPHLFHILLQLLKTDTPLTQVTPPSSPQQLAMKQLSPAFFEQLGSHSLQLEVFRCLVDILVETKSSDITASIKHMIGKYSLTVDLLSEEILKNLQELGEGELSLPTPKKIKRVTRSSEPASDMGSSGAEGEGVVSSMWRRVAVVLELVEGSCHLLPKAHHLMPVFFNCLSRILEVEEKERVCLEYVQQLVLSCMLTITEHYSSLESSTRELLSESEFNVELVVQCIRLSGSPQTHHHALLLLTSTANIFPSLVLHNIMPIFTFMGAQLLHQDDLYSFQVITKTIDTVIPTLIKSGSLLPKTPSRKSHSKMHRPGGSTSLVGPHAQSTVEGIVTEVIRIFVDALPHIPDHRKLPLFGHLLRTMGSHDYLHVALGIMMEKRVGQEKLGDSQEQMVEEIQLESGLIVGVAQQFSPADQIRAAGKLAEYLSHLPDIKPTTTYKLRHLPPTVSSLFNVASHSDQQLQSFKLASLSFLCTLLSHPDFLSQVASVQDGELEEEVLNVLRVILKYVSHLSSSEVGQEGGAKKGTISYKCLKCSYSVLDKVTSLLLPASFLDVMVQLVGVAYDEKEGGAGVHDDVQRRALEILASKLEARTLKFRKDNVDALLDLGGVCIDVGASITVPTQSRQAALKCVQLIIGQLSVKHSEKIQQLAERVIQLLSSSDVDGDIPPSVRGRCLLCVPELCLVLGPHLIPLLPSLLPLVIRHLENKAHNKRCERLVLDALTSLHALVKTLPNFMSSYIPDIIVKLCQFVIAGSGSLDNTKIKTAATAVRVDVSKNVPVRNLLASYQQCYNEVMSCGKDSVLYLLSMLSATFARLTKEDIRIHEDLICDIIMTSLDYRTSHTHDFACIASVEPVEERCVQVFTDLTIKLSEPQFRQFFLKLLDWATSSSAPKLRLITFYHLASKTAEKLKNLFLLFAGHFFTNAVHLLDITHSQKEGSTLFSAESGGDVSEEDKELAVSHCCLLLDCVLQCLSKCFLYDRTEFMTRERFDAILQPLVNQVTNMVGGKGQSMKRVESNVAECVAHLGMALGKEDLWQKLNYQLLLKTRHKKSYVRSGTLKVLKQFYSKLGEEFDVLVPQTIPFLTELLEDDSEEVEALAQEILGSRV